MMIEITQAASNHHDGILRGVVFCLILGSILVWRAIHTFRKRRLVEDTATIKVHAAAVGLTELQGYAWPIGDETTSLEGRRCLYYDLRVEERRQSGKNSHWVTIFKTQNQTPFLLADGSGHCLVVPYHADYDIHESTTYERKLTQTARMRLREISSGNLSLSGTGFLSGLFSTPRRVVEKKILTGSPLYVRGDFQPYPTPTTQRVVPGLSRFLSRALKYKGKHDIALSLFDTDRNGTISDRELTIGHHSLALSSIHRAATDSPTEAGSAALNKFEKIETTLTIGTVSKSTLHPLLIADVHEERLVRRHGSLNFYAPLVGGALLIGLGVFIFYKYIVGGV